MVTNENTQIQAIPTLEMMVQNLIQNSSGTGMVPLLILTAVPTNPSVAQAALPGAVPEVRRPAGRPAGPSSRSQSLLGNQNAAGPHKKRGPGRPKGSKNKPKPASVEASASE